MLKSILFCNCISVIQDIFISARHDKYATMCAMILYETSHKKSLDYVRSGGGRPIPDTSNTDALKPLCIIINFMYSGLKSLEVHYAWSCQECSNKKI